MNTMLDDAVARMPKKLKQEAANELKALRARLAAAERTLQNQIAEIDENYKSINALAAECDELREYIVRVASIYNLNNERADDVEIACVSLETMTHKARALLDEEPQLCAGRDALRGALEQLATQAEYLAGRGFVGNMKRKDCEKQTIELARKARVALTVNK